MRRYLYDLLKGHGYKVYSQGQLKTPVDYPYIVILMGEDTLASNRLGSYQMAELLCYVPDTSIFQLDDMIISVRDIIKNNKLADEFTGINRDYHDTTLRAYMRNLKFKIPHTTY